MGFGRTAALLALATGLALGPAPAARARLMPRQLDMIRLADQARTAAATVFQSRGEACAGQAPVLTAVLADRRFDRLPVDIRRGFLFAVLMCGDDGDPARPLEAARRLEPLAEDPVEIAAIAAARIGDALGRGDHVAATRLFLDMAGDHPDIVAGWEPELVGAFTDYLDADPDLAIRALKTIAALPWTSEASARAARNEWALALGWQLADRGRLEEAAAAVEKADSLYARLVIAGDRRFERLWPRFAADGRFDWTALGEAQLARARAEVADHPDSLRPAAELVAALRALGRHQEAIAVGEAFRARIEDGEAFEDAGAQSDELLKQLAQALFETGQTARAEAVFRQAIGDDSRLSPAVEARLAYAGRLYDLDRPGEALTVLDGVDPGALTPFGRLWLTSLRACALNGRDAAGAAAAFETLRAGRDENPAALGQALLCAGRIDEAAELMIWRLASPRHRAGALDPFWAARPPPVVPPGLARFEANRQAMLGRPAVRTALAKVGRPVEIPLGGDYWGGY